MSGNRYIFLVYLAVFILFIHAIIQQRIISTIREEIALVLNKNSNNYNSFGNANKVSASSTTLPASSQTDFANFYLNTKSPPNLPSVRLSDEEEKKAAKVRDIYGGKKDALHLGGFTEIDHQGISHNLWNFMLGPLAIKSVVDVGCGRGHSTSYFMKKGAKVLCVEGSHDAVTQSLLPADKIVEHDFSRGILQLTYAPTPFKYIFRRAHKS